MPVCSGIGGAGDGVPIWPESNGTPASSAAFAIDEANDVSFVDSTSVVSCAQAGATAAANRITARLRVANIMAVGVRRTRARAFCERHARDRGKAGEPSRRVHRESSRVITSGELLDVRPKLMPLALFHRYSP